MPMMQEDFKQHYEQEWRQKNETAVDDEGLRNSSPIDDAVMYPIYQPLLADLNVKVDGGKILDVGAGTGRWVRYFIRRFKPALLLGIDFAQASVDLLNRRYADLPNIATQFKTADITAPGLELGERFDLINVMNVLFHIPEPDRFNAALKNLANHLAAGGRIVTTEYMPRSTMRTNWMLVRNRYEFEAAAAAAGLRIAAIKACSFFSTDPMGLDGLDTGLRGQMYQVKGAMNQLMATPMNESTKEFFLNFLGAVDSVVLNFCKDRLADVEMPAQKLVALARD